MVEENPIAHSLRLLWEGLPEPRKGPRPTLTLDRIVTAAVGVADAEGIAALSMRRLAAELGVGTMSLYRYVPGKDELLNLVFDHVSAPGDERPWGGGSWRETLEISAWGQRALYQAHPWLLQVNGARPVMGPSAVSALEWMMRGLVDLPFGDREKMMVVTEVDSYVTGSVRAQILYEGAAAESGVTDDEFWTFQLPWLERAMESGDFPAMAALGEDSFDGTWEEGFALGLRFLLDGIEREVERRTS